MNRSFLGRFIDNTVICLISVLLSFLLFKSFFANNILCISLALLFGLVILKTLLHFQNKKYAKLNIEKEEKKNIELTNFELRKLTFEEQNNLFLTSLPDSVKCDNYIICKNSVAIFNNLNKDQTNAEDIFFCYSKAKPNKNINEIIILANNIHPEAFNLVKRFNDISIFLFSPIEIYAILKKYNNLPEIQKTQKQVKILKIKDTFARKQAKSFLKCGILLYIAGLFVPFTKYYIITASVCLLLAGICLCFGIKENKNSSYPSILTK